MGRALKSRRRSRLKGMLNAIRMITLAALLASGFAFANAQASLAQTQSPPPAAGVRPIGTIKAIQAETITLTTDAGPELQVQVQDSTRLLRIEPGQKDLKGATPVQLQD